MLKLMIVLAVVGLATAGLNFDNAIICAEESGASMDAYKNYEENYIIDPEDHSLKCMVKCMLAKESFVDDDGVLNAEAAADYRIASGRVDRTRDELLALLRQCDNSNVEGDACDKAFFLTKCFINLKKSTN